MIEMVNDFNLVKTSYSQDDVVILLKDLTGKMEEYDTQLREKMIQNGVHYSSMLPEEKVPSDDYMKLYREVTQPSDLIRIANLVQQVAIRIYNNTTKGELQEKKVPVLISLARAGIPVGILIKRYIKLKYGVDCPHYSISIIRDKGIDINAMKYIYSKEVMWHQNIVDNFFFIDGWTGKGAIKNQLDKAVDQLRSTDYKRWEPLKSDLYVLADPANITEFCGTKEDYLLPSACLNSTISGLISRTILNEQIDTFNGDFHGAVYFQRFAHKSIDLSNEFIDNVNMYFDTNAELKPVSCDTKETGMEVVNRICRDFDVSDYKKVKPGVGEATRVLLRRVPWKVLINTSEDDKDIQHILLLCNNKNVPVERYNLGNYKVCGIIKELADA